MHDPINTVNRALAALTEGRVIVRKGTYNGRPTCVIIASQGCDEYKFDLGFDGKWRLGTVSTYGNTSFLYGKGCDASGWVVTPQWVKVLEKTAAAR